MINFDGINIIKAQERLSLQFNLFLKYFLF